MSKNTMTKKYTKFEPNRIHFTDLEENKRSKGQKIAYVRYNDKKKGDTTLFLQTPKIHLNTYGIPKAGDYYSDNKQRSFIKVPLNTEEAETKLFYDKLSELDKYLDSDEMRIKIFGSLKKSKGYKYNPIVRQVAAQTIEENSDSDSDDDGKTQQIKKTTYPRPPYFKAKMNLDWDSGNITTKMFKLVDGERVKSPVKTLENVEELVTFMSTIRMVLMPNKLWALKTFDGKKYGLSFKIMHLEVEPVQRRSLKEYFENDAFVDSDDDSGEDTNDDTANTTTSTTPVLNTSALDNGNDNEESDDSDEEEENSDSSESEEEPVVAKKVSAKRGRKKKTLNASA
jgi:hypothetical protein